MQPRRRRVARRVAFSPYATAVLTTAFSISSTPTKEQREALAEAIGTSERRVQVWFQNRRQRAHVAPTADPVPRPIGIGTRAASASAAAASAAQSMPMPDPYPVNVGMGPLANEDGLVPVQLPPAVPIEHKSLKEGLVKADMKMEAFTTLFPPFEVRLRHPTSACAHSPHPPLSLMTTLTEHTPPRIADDVGLWRLARLLRLHADGDPRPDAQGTARPRPPARTYPTLLIATVDEAQ